MRLFAGFFALCLALATPHQIFAAPGASDAAEITIGLPDASAMGRELKTTIEMLSKRRTPLWLSDVAGLDVNCGGLDLFEVAQAAASAPVAVSAEMMGSPEYRLRIGERFRLQFKTAHNRAAYAKMVEGGEALPAYACWCAYGLGHPKTPHLAAPNNPMVTLLRSSEGGSGLYFNLRERFESWTADPQACIAKSETTATRVITTLDVETKRPFDRVFDTPPGSRPLPVEPCQ